MEVKQIFTYEDKTDPFTKVQCVKTFESVSKDYELEILAPYFSPIGRLLEICPKVGLFYKYFL